MLVVARQQVFWGVMCDEAGRAMGWVNRPRGYTGKYLCCGFVVVCWVYVAS
jgi:hypothetical protein